MIYRSISALGTQCTICVYSTKTLIEMHCFWHVAKWFCLRWSIKSDRNIAQDNEPLPPAFWQHWIHSREENDPDRLLLTPLHTSRLDTSFFIINTTQLVVLPFLSVLETHHTTWSTICVSHVDERCRKNVWHQAFYSDWANIEQNIIGGKRVPM